LVLDKARKRILCWKGKGRCQWRCSKAGSRTGWWRRVQGKTDGETAPCKRKSGDRRGAGKAA